MNDLYVKIQQLLETAEEASTFIINGLKGEDYSQAVILLDDLVFMYQSLSATIEKNKGLLKENFLEHIILNCIVILTDTKDKLEQGQYVEAFNLFAHIYQGLNFHFQREVKAFLYKEQNEETFQQVQVEEFELMDDMRRNHMAIFNKYKEEKYKYKVSIFIGAYNNLALTQKCIDALFKYTPGFGTQWELITKSDGSTDGVEEYLESLPHEKKFSLKYNIRLMDPMVYAAEGKYVVGLSNDVMVTENWLDNLLTCIESSPNIGMVVPTTNTLSNGQTIPVSYHNEEEMFAFAAQHNKSNSSKWFEMYRLINFVFISPSYLLKNIHIDDHAMVYGHFGDDDLSLRIRRTGYRLIYTEDTFLHHYGSATYSQIGQDKMALMEEYMVRKHGFTTWGKNLPDHNGFNILAEHDFSDKQHINMLCLGDNLGGAGLNVKNILQRKGCLTTLYGGLFGELYRPYVESSYAKTAVWYTREFAELMETPMDVILIPHLEDLGPDYLAVLNQLKKCLKPAGRVYFCAYNKAAFSHLMAAFYEQYSFETVASRHNRATLDQCFDLNMLLKELNESDWQVENQLKLEEQVNPNQSDALRKALDNAKRYSKKEWEAMLKTKMLIVSLTLKVGVKDHC